MTDKQVGRKVGLASPNMRAQYALVDPLLTLGLPPAPTAQTGIDALAQAIGGTIVTNGNPLSMAVGLEACRYVAAALETAVRDGSNVEARRAMSLASLLGGLSMNLSDCAADHALAQAMGGYLSLPHGLTVGLVLAETLDVSRRVRAGARARGRRPRRGRRRQRRRIEGGARGAPPAGRGVAADGVRGGPTARAHRRAHAARARRVLHDRRSAPLDGRRRPRGVPGSTGGVRPVRSDAGGYPDNHNHFVMAGDIDAMVEAAERHGISAIAFSEHNFHLDEAREAIPYLAARWTPEGPPLPLARYVEEVRTAGERSRVQVLLGLEVDVRPEDDAFEQATDAFTAHRDDWDIVLGSVHTMSDDVSVQDEPVAMPPDDAWADYLERVMIAAGVGPLRRDLAPGAARLLDSRHPCRASRACWTASRASPRAKGSRRGQRLPTSSAGLTSWDCSSRSSRGTTRRSAWARTRTCRTPSVASARVLPLLRERGVRRLARFARRRMELVPLPTGA